MELLDIVKGIIEDIKAFDKVCEAEEHTDTGDAWNLFHEIRETLEETIERWGR